MSASARFEIVDVTDESVFGRLPPCVDPRFDHRSCDYWEDDARGSKATRSSWWQPSSSAPSERQVFPASDNPFAAGTSSDDDFNPFSPAAMAAAVDPLGGDDLFATPDINPFAPHASRRTETSARPRKLRLLTRGAAIFGSYAKVLLVDGRPSVYAQFGPLSAYPRALGIRELYPRLPQSPPPAVITCIASVPEARRHGIAAHLVETVCADLAGRGFAAIEAYPDLTLKVDEASAAHPAFWLACGFDMAIDDERYPVMRRSLGPESGFLDTG